MNLTLLCRRVIFIAVLLALLFDLYLYAFGGMGDTESAQIFGMTGGQWTGKILTFCVGFLAGHFISPYPAPAK